jgi:uncharacterized protein (TIGR03437 family)
MKRAISALFLLVFAGFGQSRSGMVDYALLLEDAPVARMTHFPLALQSADAQAQMARIRGSQSSLLAELRSRKVSVGGASQVLVNAIFVRTTPETAAQLLHLPGVVHVVRVPRLHRDLNTALGLVNVPGAWNAISGGSANAGAGIKIGIIDSGIDQNHPGFQDLTLKVPTGFPKCDVPSNCAFTNNKVIVARSYVALDSYTDTPPVPDPIYSTPDDTTPRDRVGHGTAIAMIAAGVQNTGPQATIQGVAPKAFLGNYKIFGSPGVNDYALYAAFVQALQDAVTDQMDIVTLSLGEGDMPAWGPLDVDPSCSSEFLTTAPCDIYAQAVETAVQAGVVVVAAAGNDGNIGVLPHTLSTIHTPGTDPSAITVGASLNSHALYQALYVRPSPMTNIVQSLNALFGDGPHVVPPIAPILDVAQLGDNGLACAPLAGSLAGAVALIQRGSCPFSDKINYAENAGAIGVVIYQQAGINTIFTSWGAQDTGIPAMMIGYTDGVTLKNMIDSNSGATAQFDLSFTPVPTTPDSIWPSSSRGPSIGSFTPSPHQTFVIKPELVAPGADIYTAAQKLDPNGDVYSPTGYAGVTGTSYAVPMVAGAVALVKQMHPAWTPAQLKSAVVNTAAPGVTDTDGITRAGVNAVGAGLLSAVDAMNVAATLDPATIAFGPIATGALPISRSLTITNVTGAAASFSFSVQPTNAASASVTVSPASLSLNAGAQNTVTVKLTGTLPTAGSYEGVILVIGPAGTGLRVPYQFLVGSGVPADIFPILDGSFIGAPGDTNWPIALRLIDAFGVPVIGTTYRPIFSVVSGGGQIASGDSQEFRYGIAGAFVNLGSQPGAQIFHGTAGSLTAEFDGYARSFPAIGANSVMDAASFHTDYGLAPGSYISIKGTDLSDATQVYSTSYLPVSLSTVSVSFDGGGLSLPGHLHFVSPGQINVQIPWEFQGQSSVAIKVTVAGNTADLQSNVYTVPLATYAPAFFLNSGTVADALDNTTGALITTVNPATAGEILQLYANGLGPVTNPQSSGDPASASPLSQTISPVTVTIGGKQATVFGGNAFLAPGFVGLYQINIQVPSGLSPGPQPIAISVGAQTSPATANGSTVILPVK